MIIISPSVDAVRRKLLDQVEAGTLTEEEACRQALELDPCDGVALLGLAAVLRQAGDLEEAERYGWRGLEAHPCEHRFYGFLASLVAKHTKSSALADGLMELGIRKVLGDEEALNEFLEESPGPVTRAEIENLAAVLAGRRESEPRRVSDILLPYRLIHELQMAPSGRLDRQAVDEIVECGGACVPLLIGVLRGWAEDELPENVDFPAEASLALLGEIGDPAALPALVEFCSFNDEVLSDIGQWALERIAARRPAETLEAFRRMAPEASPTERAVIARTVIRIPAAEGAGALLLSLLADLRSVPKSERDALFLMLATGLLKVEGERGPALVKSEFDRHARELSQKGRSRCYQLLKNWDRLPAGEPEEDERTVHDFCCWRDHADEEPRKEEEEWKPEKLPPGRGPDSVQTALRARVLAFSEEALRDREMEQAARIFFGPSSVPGPGGTDQAAFTEWVLYDYVAPRLGRTLTEEFLARNRGQLTDRECSLIEQWSRSRFSLFEVQRVEPEEGIEIKDLLTGEVLFARDVTASRHSALWDCLLIRVEEAEGGGMQLSGVGLAIPRPHCQPLRQWILGEQEKSGLPWPRYLRANSHRLRQKALELHEKAAASLKMMSAEGDPLVFSKAAYDVLDGPAVVRALESSEVLDRIDPAGGEFDWYEKPRGQSDSRRVLGTLRIEAGRLVLECNSRQRLARGRDLLENLAGAAVLHRGDEFTGFEKAMRQVKRSGSAPANKVPPEIEREIVQKAMAAHYRTWPDTPLPALGGKTPRQAVATPEGREQVIDLLKLIENGEARNRREGRAWYDISELKAELRLEF